MGVVIINQVAILDVVFKVDYNEIYRLRDIL